MSIWQILSLVFVSVFIGCAFIGIAFVFYLGRTRVKQIDKLIYGFEIPHDSIFFKLQRVPSYGAACAWHWGAKRSGMLKIRDQFDKDFQKPFIITFWLFVVGTVSILIGIFIGITFLGM